MGTTAGSRRATASSSSSKSIRRRRMSGRATSSSDARAGAISSLEVAAAAVGGLKEATHIVLELTVLELAAAVEGADEAVHVVPKLAAASSSSMIRRRDLPPSCRDPSARPSTSARRGLAALLPARPRWSSEWRGRTFPRRGARGWGRWCHPWGPRRESVEEERKIAGNAVYCGDLKHSDPFPGSRCRALTCLFVVPWRFEARGATSLTVYPEESVCTR